MAAAGKSHKLGVERERRDKNPGPAVVRRRDVDEGRGIRSENRARNLLVPVQVCRNEIVKFQSTLEALSTGEVLHDALYRAEFPSSFPPPPSPPPPLRNSPRPSLPSILEEAVVLSFQKRTYVSSLCSARIPPSAAREGVAEDEREGGK